MTKPIDLEYGKRPRSRLVRRLVILLMLLLGFTALFLFRAPVKIYLREHYERWKFARLFDRISDETVGRTSLWKGASSNVDGDKLLTELLTASSSFAAGYHRGLNKVLLIKAGKTGDQPWLAFVCISETGLEIYTFDRGSRSNVDYQRPFETRQFWSSFTNSYKNLKFGIGDEVESGDHVRAAIIINDEPNIVDFSIKSVTPATATVIPGAAQNQLTVCSVVPNTGWITNTDWWPQEKSVTMIEGRAAPVPSKSINSVQALSFVPDGRLAVIANGNSAIVDPQSGKMELHAIPKSREEWQATAFSPDGTFYYLGSMVDPSFVIRSLSGAVVGQSDSKGIPKASFIDDQTLLLQDNTSLRTFNCVSEQWASEPTASTSLKSYVRAGGTTAYTDYSGTGIHLHSAQGDKVIQLQVSADYAQLSLSPDGNWLTIKNNSLGVFDTQTGKCVLEHNMDGDLDRGSRVKWSRDGTMGATAGSSYIYLWSLRTPRWFARFAHVPNGYWSDVAISHDCKSMAASWADSATISYWPNITAATHPWN